MLSRLPAEARAQVAWAKKPVDAALVRLRTEPLTDELIVAVADEFWKPFSSLLWALRKVVAVPNLDEWRAKLSGDIALETQSLAEFVEEEGSRENVRWIFGLLDSLLNLVLSVRPPPEPMAEVNESLLFELGKDDEFMAYLRGSVALMAAIEERRSGQDRQRARDLLDVAFLRLNRFRAALRRRGIFLTPFPHESVEERHHALLESAHRLRNVLTEDDWRTLDRARMRDLR